MRLDPGRSTTTTAVVSASSPPPAPARTLGVTSVSDPANWSCDPSPFGWRSIAAMPGSVPETRVSSPGACDRTALTPASFAWSSRGACRRLHTRPRAASAVHTSLGPWPGAQGSLPLDADRCQPRLNLCQTLLCSPKLPYEPLPPCCVLWRRGVEFGLVGGYLARQLGALAFKGLPLVRGRWHRGMIVPSYSMT